MNSPVKERTRKLLLVAVREQVRTGGPLTVPAVAATAGVSRATAYRYFPTNDSVVVHASLPPTDDPLSSLDPTELAGDDIASRAATLVRLMGGWAFDHETELRTFLRLSLEPGRGAGRGNTSRERWIAALLKGLPDDVSPESRRRLAAALTPLFGADAVVWTTDMAGLDREAALSVLEWAARSLVEATVRDR